MMMNDSSDNTHLNVPAVAAWASSSSQTPQQQQYLWSSSVSSSANAPSSSTAQHFTTSTATGNNRHASMINNSPYSTYDTQPSTTTGRLDINNDETMDTDDADDEGTTATQRTATTTTTTITSTPCASFDSIDTHASTAATNMKSGMCPLFMDGLPSDFNQNSQLAALASLLDDEVREEHVDDVDVDDNDDQEEQEEGDDGQDQDHHRHQNPTINVLPTIPEERAATTSSASIVITSPKVTGIKTYGRHDLVLQQRKWQRDQRILRSMKKNGGGKATTTMMALTMTKNSKTNSSSIKNKLVSIQKGPRSMTKTSPSRKNSSKRLMSKHYKTNTTSGSYKHQTNCKSERMGYGDEKLRRRDCNTGNNNNNTATATATTKGDGVITMTGDYVANINNRNMPSSASSSLASSSRRLEASTTPSVGETTLFLNMWKL